MLKDDIIVKKNTMNYKMDDGKNKFMWYNIVIFY